MDRMPTTEQADIDQTDIDRTGPRQSGSRNFRENAPKSHSGLSTLYFAYGSNLNIEQMLQRCPTAKPVGPLTLPDWRLEFRGVADIVPCPGAEVVGALYRVWKQDELALDRYEGYRRSDPQGGLYRKVYCKVEDTEGRVSPFMFYVMNQDGVYPPQRYYLETIRQGFADWHLPTDTLEAAVQRSLPGQGYRLGQDYRHSERDSEEFFTRDLFGEEYTDV